MWIDTWVGSETGSRPCANLNHFYGAFLLGSFWPIFLSCLVLSPFGTSQGLPMCTGISQPRWMPVKSVWQIDTTPLLTFKKFSSWEDLLDLENEKYVVSYLLSGQGPASSLDCPTIGILEFSMHRKQTLMGWGQGCLIYLLPQMNPKFCSSLSLDFLNLVNKYPTFVQL